MVRSEGLALNPQLSVQLADLGRDLSLTQVTLQPLSQAEILQLLEAIVGEGAPWTSNGGERRQPGLRGFPPPGHYLRRSWRRPWWRWPTSCLRIRAANRCTCWSRS